MKKIAAIIALLITISYALCTATVATASAAAPRYAYADLNSKVYFCSEKSAESALFIIPQTYCVEVLADEGEWYYAKYAEDNALYRAVFGYCLKSEMKPINEPLENTYLNLTVKLTFSADSSTPQLPFPSTQIDAAYYGEYELGKTTLSYVYCCEKFGYVTQKVENYPLNELPVHTDAPTTEEPPKTNAAAITAIIITVIAVAAVIILYVSSRKPKPAP